MTTRTAGPDYWFVDPTYVEVDRLAEDECPLDDIDAAADWEMMDAEVAALHSAWCPHVGRMGVHLPENCIAGGV